MDKISHGKGMLAFTTLLLPRTASHRGGKGRRGRGLCFFICKYLAGRGSAGSLFKRTTLSRKSHPAGPFACRWWEGRRPPRRRAADGPPALAASRDPAPAARATVWPRGAGGVSTGPAPPCSCLGKHEGCSGSDKKATRMRRRPRNGLFVLYISYSACINQTS